MANTLLAAANINFTGNWLTCDATALSDSEATQTALTAAYQESTAFTPGAITVDGVAIKVSSRASGSPSNTLTVRLAQGGVDVAGTVTTMNVSDIAACSTTAAEGGWYYFRFNVTGTPTPVLLAAATAYTLSAKLSATTTAVSLYVTAGTNWSRQVVTTTTASPAAADKLIVCGDNLAAGTKNSYTVTMENTATTSFGAVTTQALAVCNGGTVNWANVASTNYYLKIKGVIRVYSGGTWTMYSSGSRLDSTSTAVIEFDSTSNVDSGIEFRNGSVGNCYGATVATVNTLLTADEAAAQTVIGSIGSTSGWANNGVIVFAGTTQSATQGEKRTISTVDSGTAVTITAGLTNAHSGTSPTQSEIIYLTRNLKIRGISTSLNGYIFVGNTATLNMSYCEIYQMGSNTANKRGIDVQTTTGSFLMEYCSFYDFTQTSATGIFVSGSASNNITISHCVGFNFNAGGINISAATSGTAITIDSNVLISPATGSGNGITLSDVGGVCTNNISTGASSSGSGFTLNESLGFIGTFSGNTAHSNVTHGFALTTGVSGTVQDCTAWRNGTSTGSGISASSCGDIIVDTFTAFGNITSNFDITGGCGQVELNNSVLNAGVTQTCPIGIRFFGFASNFRANNTTMGATTTHATGDIQIGSGGAGGVGYFNNCLFGSTTEISQQTFLSPSGFMGSEKHDQTTGSNKTWRRNGTLQIDTTANMFDVTPSLRMTPNNATNKLQCLPFSVACKSGSDVTVSVKVRESVSGDGTDYNGNRARLIVLKNYSVGITSDTVLATASGSSEGAFEKISGTTASPSEDGVLNFIVDCDGTTGWVNVDTFTASPNTDTKGFKYWQNGSPVVLGDNSAQGFILL